MSKYRKQFLNILKPIWKERLPDWQPGLFSPSFYTKPEATFSWTRFAPDSPTRLHACIEFSSKEAGTFTCDIFIMDAANQADQKLSHRWADDIPSRKLGVYRIGQFIFGKDVWWHLKDEVAESNKYWESVGASGLACLERQKYGWYAASYDVPLKQIMQEAAEDFTNQFTTRVIPKLFSE